MGASLWMLLPQTGLAVRGAVFLPDHLMFAYFYMSIQYNPWRWPIISARTTARSGHPSRQAHCGLYLQNPSKITLIGALFLALWPWSPSFECNVTAGMYGLSMGGTSILIIVGVALDTVKQLESQMMMRHYKGFLWINGNGGRSHEADLLGAPGAGKGTQAEKICQKTTSPPSRRGTFSAKR